MSKSKNNKKKNEVDPELLQNLDLLMNLELLEQEGDWQEFDKEEADQETETEED